MSNTQSRHPAMKRCWRGQHEVPVSDFHADKGKKDGLQSSCKACQYARYLERLEQDPEAVRAIGAASQRRHRRRRLYGITNEQYEAMVAERDGCCDVCGKKAKLVCEHDHATGKLRGLTCSSCNTVLGHAYDSPAILRAAADYLER